MIVQLTKIWELSMFGVGSVARATLAKAYGSKRSGTVYLVADNEGEAIAVAKELFKTAGLQAPVVIHVQQTHLVHKAVRAVF